MRVGDLVNDKRCKSATLGKSGLILAVVGKMCWVMWPSSPDFPLWAPANELELINEHR